MKILFFNSRLSTEDIATSLINLYNILKKYTNMSPYYYWNKTRDEAMINRKIQGFLTEVFELLGAHGEKVVLKKEYLKRIYDKHIKTKTRRKN